ncbi:MAG: chemotaxis protein CheW [Gemmatimonadaceae bacterium]
MENLSPVPLSETVGADAARDALLVRIGREYVAVWLDAVVSQLHQLELRPLPDWRVGVAGLIRSGDRFVPLYRPEETLGIARDDSTVERCAIVVRGEDATIALAIDEPLDVLAITDANLRQPPAAIAEDGVVQALAWFDGVLVSVLDPRALVAACQAPATESATGERRA